MTEPKRPPGPALLTPRVRPASRFYQEEPDTKMNAEGFRQSLHLIGRVHAVRGRRKSAPALELIKALQHGTNCEYPGFNYFHGHPLTVVERRGNQHYVRVHVPRPWQLLNDLFEAFAPDGGYVRQEEINRHLDVFVPDLAHLLPHGLDSLETLYKAFPGTFRLRKDSAVQRLRPFGDPDPENAIPIPLRHQPHTHDDALQLASIAGAAHHNYYRLFPDTHNLDHLLEAGRRTQPDLPCWQSKEALDAFTERFARSNLYYKNEGYVHNLTCTRKTRITHLLETAIRILADDTAWASITRIRELLGVWLPGSPLWQSNASMIDILKYHHYDYRHSFAFKGRTRIATAISTHADHPYDYTAALYYTRHLAKKKALEDGLAYLHGIDFDRTRLPERDHATKS